jgi:DNA invertase Pin-like site-specific DNA recombinase
VIAAIYARKSTEQKNTDPEARSVPLQIDNARAFAKSQQWTVPEGHVYKDDKVSGAETKRLVDRQRLLDLALSGRAPFQVVVMRDQSRFSREDGDVSFGELKRLAQAGIEIVFYADGSRFKFGTFSDNIVGFVNGELAAEYRRLVGRWTADAMVRKAKAGHVCGGKVFGYENVPVNGHKELRVLDAEAAVVRRIFELSASGCGYARIARQLNAERAVAPREATSWSRMSVHEILRRPLYRGEVVWNKTKKRNAEGKVAVTRRPPSEWERREDPALQIVSDEVWDAVQARLAAMRAKHDHGVRAPRRDADSKYLLTGFARCGACGGGLHVRSRAHGKHRRAFFYACTTHYNRGPQACGHVDQWPMEEIDHEVLAEIRRLLDPHAVDDLLTSARRMFEASAEPEHLNELKRELATLERARARLTEAITSSDEVVSVLVEKLRETERRRAELLTRLKQIDTAAQRPVWREIERDVRRHLADWGTLLRSDVAQARGAFRRLLTAPIRFTPGEERGHRALRFEGQCDFEAAFGGVVTRATSPTGFEPVF